ncbi:divergent PAP2 family protein [Paenactinomyces guangxiensis]|uniref:Divergent PAP2 family protein n=1 Tax=Paenactinomyces guangxiensis TaxID=1490290 RepID=A0A7W1WPM8_9BACL|nr:divergent PAP2 family protein [Paenactinomyces guangxiensis]MBA4493764.1 divergent PAP2 family protein [Paenactinomyces guangxiensis]MBH8591052.1 divergent PAP2 family protein [Paenactinomyces guangxiensis]
MLGELLTNFPLWTSLIAITLAQFSKVPWNYTITKKWDWNWLINSGGMPSGHTSAVTSLATSIGLTKGWDSSSFAIATIFGIIVMYDATGVRRQAGMQAQVLNQLVEDFAVLLNELRHLTDKKSDKTRVKLKEILGHQPIEVFTGAWFGIMIALVMYWLWY